MMARHTDAEVNVIGLIGERGREAREFIEDSLGDDGMGRSVVVVATSDQPPPVRRQAAYTTMAIAEYLPRSGARRPVPDGQRHPFRHGPARDRPVGRRTAGEQGIYTPSVFAELPRLLERAGPGAPGQGSITGLFTVLVEGDDHNEPIADAVRGILDGHVVLDRGDRRAWAASRRSTSCAASRGPCPAATRAEENAVVDRARRLLATYEDMAELIRLGAYRRGTDPEIDEAIDTMPALEAFLRQTGDDRTELQATYTTLAGILGITGEGGPSPDDGAPV